MLFFFLNYSYYFLFSFSTLILLLQVPGETLKLKQLKVLIDEHSSVFSNCSKKRDALAFLKRKVCPDTVE